MPSPRHAPIQFTAPDLALAEAARHRFKHAELAPATILSYQRDWRVFSAWCAAASRSALPASSETVELYVADMLRRGRKVSTIERHVIGIQHYHRRESEENPCGPELRRLLAGARRVLCQQPAQKDAIRVEDLRAMVQATGNRSPIAARNSALLLLGFATALRRSNLARLQLEDLRLTAQGFVLWIAHEKQDRTGRGRHLAVGFGSHRATCPVRAMRRWMEYRGDEPGPLFCHVMRGHVITKGLQGNRVAQIVQEAAAAAGLDRRHIGAHSLRAGLVTAALENGAGEVRVAEITGHRSIDTLRRYFRPALLSTAMIGL